MKRIAWRLQAHTYGGPSERTQRRAQELANEADLGSTVPKATARDGEPDVKARVSFRHDSRVPPPGSILARPYKGRNIVVKVRPEGCEFEGKIYRSLSGVATAVTGTHWNGCLFFRLP